MKRTKFILFFAILGTLVLSQYQCAEIIQSECELQFFEGTYVGVYSLGGLADLPAIDTVNVEVDLETNKAVVTSKALGVSFDASYQENNKQLVVGLFIAEEFIFEIDPLAPDTLFDISIQSATITLDSKCDNLYIKLKTVRVEDYTDGLNNFLGDPPLQLSSLEGKDMQRIR